jgi:anti-sigma regulatory factor (Ser/Thr protein kinase)
MESIAGVTAAALAEAIGSDSAQAKDVEVAVSEACSGLGGRFFVGACEAIVVLLRAHPGELRVLVFGDGRGRSKEHVEAALDAYDADVSLGMLRSLMDTVTVRVHERCGFCIAMTKRREAPGKGRCG